MQNILNWFVLHVFLWKQSLLVMCQYLCLNISFPSWVTRHLDLVGLVLLQRYLFTSLHSIFF